jgi:CheY-specific phosphatase CheX
MSGEVVCTVPESLVQELATTFAGLEPGAPIDESLVIDLMGEFANMVCGRWLSRVSNHSQFDLRPPTVTRIDTTEPGASAQMPSLVNGVPAMLRVVVTRW